MWTPRELDRLLRFARERLAARAAVFGDDLRRTDLPPTDPRHVLACEARHWERLMAEADRYPFAVCRLLDRTYPHTRDPVEVFEQEHRRILAEAAGSEEAAIVRALALCRHYLQRFEQRYGCLSPEFYPRYAAGLWHGPPEDSREWALLYRQFHTLLRLLSRLRQSTA